MQNIDCINHRCNHLIIEERCSVYTLMVKHSISDLICPCKECILRPKCEIICNERLAFLADIATMLYIKEKHI